ncbi:MAG: RNA degradosome polyphosphate kinase [Nocardioidaceae bacterium]
MPGTSASSTSSAPEKARVLDDLAEELEEFAAEAGRVDISGLPGDRLLDRENSWLEFNARVLELAQDDDLALLDRVRFLAIFASNLDEFFMVRVAGLRRQLATGLTVTTPTGLSVHEQLSAVSQRVQVMLNEHARVFGKQIRPALAEHGILILHWDELAAEERHHLHSVFREQVYPVLTPLAVDPAHPFPYISGLSLNLAVILRDPASGREHFARVKVPPILPRFVPLADDRFVPLEDVIAEHLAELFTGLEVVQHFRFRVTRNEDVQIEEEDAENLLTAMEEELQRRRFGPAVRLEVEAATSEQVLDLLVRELGITPEGVYRVEGLLDLTGLYAIADLDHAELKSPRFVPATHPRLRAGEGERSDIFGALRSGDVLVHHPYDSFATSVQAFIEQAADDPNVLAIKQTLYRTSGDSPIVDTLIDAAEAGKQVLVIVELKARFDEQANIRWARALEKAGCHVVYGLVGLKTHCKLSLVVRHEDDGRIRRYSHVGTGNYNPKTARIYEDLGLLTADPDVGADLGDLFNHLSGFTRQRSYSRLLVAPDTLRAGLLSIIARETEHAIAGRPAGIQIKLNALVDEDMIDALYTASQAGVPIDLIVRGMCTLRPGVPGLSETITVRSILGTFLEHSRVLRFANGGQEEFWIGSADLMHRNLDRRVEALVRVEDPNTTRELAHLLDLATSDRTMAWTMQPDGTYIRERFDDRGRPLTDYQHELLGHRSSGGEQQA